MTTTANIAIPPLMQTFTYIVPETIKNLDVGYRVEVPFGRRKATGFVVSTAHDQSKQSHDKKSGKTFELKELKAKLEEYPCFNPDQLKFFQWVANYYGDSLSNVIDVAIPHAVAQKLERHIHLVGQATDANKSRSQLRNSIIKELTEIGGSAPYSFISKKYKGSTATLKKLEAEQIIKIDSNEIIDQHISQVEAPSWAKRNVQLNPQQKLAVLEVLKAVHGGFFKPFLLHGITGSGKTEVYLEIISELREQGLGALVVVPEIALTPQLIDRFRARLGNEIAILHSGLNRRVRWDSWRALVEGRNSIAIGVRSAIFAPVKKLGVVIVDEEHDGSFKQSEGLRYNARDLAVLRAQFDNCPVVLGSATPSLETFYNATTGKYTYLELNTRPESLVNNSIEVVDLNQTKPWEMTSKNISPQLFKEIKDTVDNGNQVFILYNRRGFSSYFQCEKCQKVLECSNCSVTLTYHQTRNSLVCHYCGMTMLPPEFCPSCQKESIAQGKNDQVPGKLIHHGAGTERIFEEIETLFPSVCIDRLDRDAVSDIEEYKQVLDKVRSGQTKILIGTQMIAKGHDLPNVTLVGVVDCDVGLHMPDFRAGERIFQLLTQAAGRAGRGEKAGKVILQTRVPKHNSLEKTVSQDFHAFAKVELAARKNLNYPPFTRLLRIIASADEKEAAAKVLHDFKKTIQRTINENKLEVVLLGPAPCTLSKLKTSFRLHLLLKSKSSKNLNQIMQILRKINLKTKKVKLIFDMDPQDML